MMKQNSNTNSLRAGSSAFRVIFIFAVTFATFSTSAAGAEHSRLFNKLFGSNELLQAMSVERTSVVLDDDAVQSLETWTGGDNNNSNWTTNSNWSGAGGAGPDDDLIFPQTASRKTNVNNFAINTSFNTLTFTGRDYSITGNQIILANGMTVNVPNVGGNLPIFGPNIILGSPSSQTWVNSNGLLTFNGVVNLNSSGLVLNLAGANSSFLFNGLINGTGTINKIGPGNTTVASNSTGFGVITVFGGLLNITGAVGEVELEGGTLLGNGAVDNIDADNSGSQGTIAPGTGGTTTAVLTSTGTVNLKSTINLQLDLNGTTGGTDYDRLTCNGGDVSLSNAQLQLTLGFTPTSGQTFTIVNTVGAGNTISGQFAQGDSIVVGGRAYSITYNSTSVILTAGPEMDVRGNSISIVDGDATPSLTDHTDFGSTDPNGGTVSRAFTVFNTGAGALNLTGAPKVSVGGTHAADFTVTVQPTSPITGPSGTTTFTVVFNPSAEGLRTATLSIANDDLNENPYNFSISGTGLTPPCTMTVDFLGNPSACNDNGTPTISTDDFFTQNMHASFFNRPLTGDLQIVAGGDVIGTFSIPVGQIVGNSHTFTNVKFKADGTPSVCQMNFTPQPP